MIEVLLLVGKGHFSVLVVQQSINKFQHLALGYALRS